MTPGCSQVALGPSPSPNLGSVSLPFTINFYGKQYSSLNVDEQGYVYFEPGDPITDIGVPINVQNDWNAYSAPLIAPFFDYGSQNPTSYGETTFNGHDALCVQWTGWENVDYHLSSFPVDPNAVNNVQMLLVNRSDIAPGDFDIVFNYGQIQWDHQCDAADSQPYGVNCPSSGPDNQAAVAGWKTAAGRGTVIQTPFDDGSYLDSSPSGLVHGSLNSSTAGQYVWGIRNPVPTPSAPPAQTLGPCGSPSQANSTFAINPSGCQAEPVNTATGNYYTTATDLRLGGLGVPFSLVRSYNSADATPGTMGIGWTDNLNAALTVQTNGDVLARWGDGQEAVFTVNADGSYSAPPGGVGSLAAISGGGWQLITHDQQHLLFNSVGELTRWTDRNGEGLTLAYNPNAR